MIDKTDPTNRDTVPAMLTPGEFVLNKEASTMFAPVIEQMNDAGLQHRAMKNMGGGIQNYNDGSAGGVKAPIQDRFKPLLDFIGSGEGGYNSSNRGTVNGEIIGSQMETTYKGKKLSEMTINEIIEAQSKTGADKLFAVGKFQIIPTTLAEVVNGLGVSGDTLFTPDFQDKAGVYLATQKRPILGKYLMGGDVDEEVALMELAKEWASAPLPYDVMVNGTLRKAGTSRYGEGNAAQHSIQEARDAIRSARSGISGFNVNPEETPQVVAQTASSEPVPRFFSGGGADGVGSFGAIGDFFGGITTPSVAPMASVPPQMRPKDLAPQMAAGTIDTMASSRPQMRPNTQADPIAVEQAIMQASVPQVQAAPPVPTNFNEAFKDARADMGAGGIFTFRGNDYSTDYAEEKDMVTANMGGAVYLNDGDPVTNPSSGFGSNIEYNYDTYLKETGYNDVPAVREMWGRYQDKMNAESAEVPMPDVNSDESLLQGSSGSVDSAARSFPSDYPINMDVPRVEGYNIPAPTSDPTSVPAQAPRPTMLGGQLYYLNGDGLVTDSNGDPVQNPEIGAAVQDKLNYSPEESAANAQAYNESIDQQNIFNGTNPQSVNPSYDSMRQQQESNAAEAEKIKAELAQIDMQRQAANDEFNNRQSEVVPPLERGQSVFVEGFVPPVANSGKGGGGPAVNMVPRIAEPTLLAFGGPGKDVPLIPNIDSIDENQMARIVANNQDSPEVVQAIANEMNRRTQVRRDAGLSDRSIGVMDMTGVQGQNPKGRGDGFAEVRARELQGMSDSVKKARELEDQRLAGFAKAKAAGITDAQDDAENSAAIEAMKTREEVLKDTISTEENRLAIEGNAFGDNVLKIDGPYTGTSVEGGRGNLGMPTKPQDNITKVKAKVDEVQKTTEPTTTVQDSTAKAEADRIAELNKKNKNQGQNTPEVSGAMSMLKSVFGDLFDTKELARAAIMYLGGRATGMSGNQALAFAGKNYIARTDAKTSFYNEQATSGKWTNGSLAKFKKTRDPAHLIPIGAVYKATGVAPQAYYDKATGNMVMFEQHQIGKDGSKIWAQAGKDPRDSKYRLDHSQMTQDTFNVKSTDAYIARWDKAENDFADIITAELLQYEIPADGDKAKSNSLKDINATTDAKAVSAFAQKYDIAPDAMALVIRNAMRKAGDDVKFSRIDEVNDLTPYLKESYITTHTGDKSNFMIGNGKKGKAYSEKLVSSESFSSWLGQTQRTMIDLLPDANLDQYNPVQFSQKLMQLPIYKEWMGEDEEVKSKLATQGSPNRSGFMEYISENLAKGVVNS